MINIESPEVMFLAKIYSPKSAAGGQRGETRYRLCGLSARLPVESSKVGQVFARNIYITPSRKVRKENNAT